MKGKEDRNQLIEINHNINEGNSININHQKSLGFLRI